MAEPCRVLVVGGRLLVAEALSRALGRCEGIVIVPAEDGPDVILVDTTGVAEEELAEHPSSAGGGRLVFLVGNADGWSDRAAAAAGAVGWLPAWVSLEVLAASLLVVARTGRLPNNTTTTRGRARRPGTEELLLRALTGREKEVLGLLASGRRAQAIGVHLSISAHTVRTHIQNIMLKLNAHSRLEAVVLANRAGLWPAGNGAAGRTGRSATRRPDGLVSPSAPA